MELFPSPDQFDDNFQAFLEEACLKLCDWFSKAEETGPLPSINDLPEVGPKFAGLSRKDLLKDLDLIMNGSFQPSHPGSLAHLDPPPLSASIVGDLICAGLNNNLLAEELSPSLSRLENNLCRWIAQKIGMKTGSGGVAASGGSLSNLMALVLARHHSGLSTDPNAVILVSEEAHVSIYRAIKIMGLPAEAIYKVSADNSGRLSINSLNEQIAKLKFLGHKCFCVVATAGTTIRGAVDPIDDISDFCFSEGLWLHVDASIGGVFSLAEETKSVVPGLSRADSITMNPQKLLGITKTSSLLLVANTNHLSSCFSIGFPYIEPSWGSTMNGGEMGMQGTRPAEILKLWLGLRQLGHSGIQALLVNSIERKTYFKNRINSDIFEIITGPLHLIALTPSAITKEQAAEWALSTRQLLMDNKFMLSRPLLNDRYYLKAVMGNPHTQNSHLDQLSNLLNQSI
ncbi:Pyridoxal-dependent decarboxylase family protein [Prochlorococcus marinus str. MIT 9211]|uniref:Pyridoxal-dependent decarboxylase family protein n=1 Tax=Prochlorococcus marinus (strain MIT 9211) TaxID=93059 RepID=A9BAU2_PROM4|nr:Pyridoxal-dependent decarboxylase family protein [Prochlorococcus marinus str. MIT 9211]